MTDLDKFTGELQPPLPYELYTKNELVAKCRDLESKWLAEQRINMELECELELSAEYQLGGKAMEKMTIEQERKMLEYAAKACGITLEREISGKKPHRLIEHESGEGHISAPWNPLTNPADTAEMCAELEIGTCWWIHEVECVAIGGSHSEPHDGTSEGKHRAWRIAATMVAAKTQGYEA